MEESRISRLDGEHLARVVEKRPEAATLLGQADHDDRWGASGPEADQALIGVLTAWAEARAAIDAGELSPRSLTQLSMDQTAIEGSLSLLRFVDERGPATRADPDLLLPRLTLLEWQAHQLAGTGPDRARAFASRLAGLKAALVAARGGVVAVDATLLDDARRRAAAARGVVDHLMAVVLRQLAKPDEVRAELNKAAGEARSAIDEHQAWLAGLTGEPGAAVLGEEGVAELLTRRRFEMDADQTEEIARAHIDEMRLELVRLRRRVFRRQSLEDALATARSQQPYTAEEAAAWLDELAQQSRRFCLEAGIFPMTDDPVAVEESPAALREAFGEVVFLPPARLPGSAARLLLADPAAGDVKAGEGLTRFSVADLECLCGRWLFPGATLLAQLAVRHHGVVRQGAPMGIVPALATTYGSDLILGWRLHAEELMRELQFRESPATRMVLCDRAAVDGILAWYDLRLAAGKASPAEAHQVLREKTGLPDAAARRLVADLVRAPGRAAGAVAGKARLMQLRRTARVKWRHGYAERRFHDLALNAGALPVAVLFGLLDDFSPFSIDEGTVEYELDERPDHGPADDGQSSGDDVSA